VEFDRCSAWDAAYIIQLKDLASKALYDAIVAHTVVVNFDTGEFYIAVPEGFEPERATDEEWYAIMRETGDHRDEMGRLGFRYAQPVWRRADPGSPHEQRSA
jgi:hypothetical protein